MLGSIIDRVDHALLNVADEAVKHFNWLTGKDNFWLARQLLLFCLFVWPAFATAAAVFIGRARWFDAIVAALYWTVISVIFWYRETGQFIDSAERQKVSDAERCVKSVSGELLLLGARRVWTAATLFLIPLIVALELAVVGDGYAYAVPVLKSSLWVIFFPSQVAIRYLVSVDIPPFAKSRAWELLKEFFTVRELAPVRVRPPS